MEKIDNISECAVIHFGSESLIAGLYSDEVPVSILGYCLRINLPNVMVGSENKTFFVANENNIHYGVISNREYALEKGLIKNWEIMEKILEYTFYDKINFEPSQKTIIISEPPLTPEENTQKLKNMLTENYNFKKVIIEPSAKLAALNEKNNFTGVVCEIADLVTYITPLKELKVLPSAISYNFGKRNLIDYFYKLINQKGTRLETDEEKKILWEIIRNKCYVSLNIKDEINNKRQGNFMWQNFESENKRIFKLGSEMFLAPEILFKPAILGLSHSGIVDKIHMSIQNSDPEIQQELYKNILICGETSAISGLADRIKRELMNIAPEKFSKDVNVRCLDDQYYIWKGLKKL